MSSVSSRVDNVHHGDLRHPSDTECVGGRSHPAGQEQIASLEQASASGPPAHPAALLERYQSERKDKDGGHVPDRYPKALAQLGREEEESGGKRSDSDPTAEESNPTPLIPFPPRPHLEKFGRKSGPPKFGSYDPLYPVIPYSIPSTDLKGPETPQLPDFGLVDNYGWNGTSSEDQLAEQIIKSGYCDKAHLLHEDKSARPSVWPHLNNKSGLRSLTSFFGSVLHQRQERGLVSATSTFRPPPRVTLTDSKREAWLRDLADDNVSLRKLSRTIPHGVRGTALFDHCVAKRIVLSRAIWLVKCVGSNELRAFRRKGVGSAITAANEAKWVREWSVLVEDYLDIYLSHRTQNDWKGSITYLLKFVTELFSQNLLDRCHFLEWNAEQLESCTIGKLPAFVLIADNLLYAYAKSYRTCRRLIKASAIRIKAIDKANSNDQTFIATMSNRLKDLLRKTSILRPKVMFLATEWPGLMETITKTNLDQDFTHDWVVANENFLEDLDMCQAAKRRACVQVAHLLDSYRPLYRTDQILRRCLTITKCPRLFVKLLLRWSVTSHRVGDFRVYLAATLLRALKINHVNIDEALFDAIIDIGESAGLDTDRAGKLVCDLTRTGDFDGHEYLRRLMAEGALYSKRSCQRSCILRTVLDLPPQCLSSQAITFRKMILRNLDHYMDEEASLSHVKEAVTFVIANIDDQSFAANLNQLDAHFDSGISQSTLTELSTWFQHELKSFHATSSADEELSSRYVQLSRCVLEHAGDMRSLAGFIQCFLKKSCVEGTMIMADIIDRHFWEFSALDRAMLLSTALIDRYRTLRLKISPNKDLIASIAPLMARLNSAELNKFIEREQELCQLNLGIAACTPASDSVADLSQSTGLTVEEELERIFASGTTMDDQTLRRVFSLITSYVAELKRSGLRVASSVATLFARLRAFDEACFDECMRTWIMAQLQALSCAMMMELIPALVGNECLVLQNFVELSSRLCDEVHDTKEPTCGDLGWKIFSILTQIKPTEAMECDRTWYKFRTECEKLGQSSHSSHINLLNIIHHVSSCSSPVHADEQKLDIAAVARITRIPLESVALPDLSKWMEESQSRWLEKVVANALDPLGDLFVDAENDVSRVSILVRNVDPFNLHWFKWAAQRITQKFGDKSPDMFERLRSILATVATDTPKTSSSLWPILISMVRSPCFVELRQDLETTVMKGLDEMLQEGDDPSAALRERVCTAIVLIQSLASTLEVDGSADFASSLAKFARDLQRHIRCSSDVNAPNQTDGERLNFLLSCTLRLSLLYMRASRPACSSIQTVEMLFSSVAALLCSGSQVLDRDSRRRLCSTAAHIVAEFDLSGDFLTQLAHDLGPAARNPDFKYLFGLPDQPYAWLHLTSSSSSPSYSSSSRGAGAGDQPHSTPFPINPWEMFADATPEVGANDTPLSLRLFGARRV